MIHKSISFSQQFLGLAQTYIGKSESNIATFEGKEYNSYKIADGIADLYENKDSGRITGIIPKAVSEVYQIEVSAKMKCRFHLYVLFLRCCSSQLFEMVYCPCDFIYGLVNCYYSLNI